VTELDVRVQKLDEGRRLGAVEVLLDILVVFPAPAAAAPVSAISEAFVLTRPVLMDVGKGEDDLTIQSPGDLTQHLSPNRIAVLESIPGEAPSRVLMVQEIHEPIRRLPSRFVCPSARERSFEEPLDGLGQSVQMACGGRSDRPRHVAVDHEVIREHNAIAGSHRADLVMAVSIECDERQLPAGSP
jgi:hypothetical protein